VSGRPGPKAFGFFKIGIFGASGETVVVSGAPVGSAIPGKVNGALATKLAKFLCDNGAPAVPGKAGVAFAAADSVAGAKDASCLVEAMRLFVAFGDAGGVSTRHSSLIFLLAKNCENQLFIKSIFQLNQCLIRQRD
jgi:hypothetical protein